MEISVRSNVGKRRKTNQDYADYFVTSEDCYLFVLCDGVGGHLAGDVASELTAKFLGNLFKDYRVTFTDQQSTEWIRDAVEGVNQYIYQKSLEDNQLEGMGTTLIMALISGDSIYIAHVGDSRAYAFSQGELVQLTEDQSLVNELIRIGEITAEEGLEHPSRNIVTQSIGITPTVSYELAKLSMHEIDRLMLCSDGLTNMLTLEEMNQLFAQQTDIDALGLQLIDKANEAGGKDNITLILLTCSQVEATVGGDGE